MVRHAPGGAGGSREGVSECPGWEYQGCRPVAAGWWGRLQPFLVASGFETSRQDFAQVLLLLEGLFSEAGLVPVEGAGETGAVVFGCEQLLSARRT